MMLQNLSMICSCQKHGDDIEEGLQSILRISSAHNKGGLPNINIVQILHFSYTFWIETLVYIHLQA